MSSSGESCNAIAHQSTEAHHLHHLPRPPSTTPGTFEKADRTISTNHNMPSPLL